MKHTNTPPELLLFAKAICKARNAAGMKQETAARALQIHRKTLSAYENGELAGFFIPMLFRMSELYACPVATFFLLPIASCPSVAAPFLLQCTSDETAQLKASLLYLIARLG